LRVEEEAVAEQTQLLALERMEVPAADHQA
jgi:hypothetical protein